MDHLRLLLGILLMAPHVRLEEKHTEHQPHPGHRGPPGGHWTYGEQRAWNVEFNECGGEAQSPINIQLSTMTYDPALLPITLTGFNLSEVESLLLRNNGHTVVLQLPDNLQVIQGLPLMYRAAQLHFHWGSLESPGSEHTVDGEHYPGEIHMVFFSSKYSSAKEAMDKPGGLAVLGAFIEEGPEENPHYAHLLQHLELVANEGQSTQVPGFNVTELMPTRMDRYFRYDGSLTTPPCFQSVNWTVFNDTIKVSKKQLELLEDTVHGDNHEKLQLNFRDAQSLNSRPVLGSFRPPVEGRRGLDPAPEPSPASPAAGSHPSEETADGAPEQGSEPLPTTPPPDAEGKPSSVAEEASRPLPASPGDVPSEEGTGADHEDGGSDSDQPKVATAGNHQEGGSDGRLVENGTAGSQPDGAAGGSQAEEGTGTSHPEEGTAGNQPEDGIGGSQPQDAATVYHAEGGTGGSQPEEGSAVNHSEESTGGNQPEEGTAVNHPEEGTGGSQPEDGAAVNHPEEGIGGSQPDEGTAVNHLEEGTDGNQPEEGTGENHLEEGIGVDQVGEGSVSDYAAEATGGSQPDKGDGESSGNRNAGPGNGGSAKHLTTSLGTGDMLAIIFGVLFAFTAVVFLIYIRKQKKKKRRMNSDNKPNVIYKAATTEDNIA